VICLKPSALLIGLGSIGKTHFSHLNNYYETINVIDNNPEVVSSSNINTAKLKFYTNVHDFLTEVIVPDLIVIANWGPEHYRYFEILGAIGTKKFIIEKPLVSKLQDLEKIQKLRQEKNLKIYMNTPWVYSRLKTQLIELQQKHELGQICNLSVVGGAKCLVTNGIHYLALAIELLGESPKYISGKCKSHNINPRSNKFLFLEGYFSFEFTNMRFLQINFSNSSKVQAQMIVTFENGYGLIEGDRMIIRVNNSSQPLLDKSPSKTFYPKQIIYDSNPFIDENNKDGIHKIYENLANVRDKDGFEHAYATMKSIFLALISNENGSMPIEASNFLISNQMLSRNWMIS
jgi:predicted dehydrogenase